jgi:hypothetical protein
MAIGAMIGGRAGMMVALLVAVGMNFFSYWFSDKMVLRMYNAQEVDESSAPQFYRMVRELAQRAQLPMPRVYLINEDAPNAFATGRNPEHAAVAATEGILRLLNDPEVLDGDKHILFLKLFFKEKIPPEPQDVFLWFLHMGEEHEGGGERDFDYEQDAAEIYSAFRQVYGIDLMDVEKLHWWRFLPMLEGLFCCENALSNKIRLRHVDDGEGQRKAAVERQKRAVRLRKSMSRSEVALEEELQERLKKGLPVADLLRR